MPKFLTIVTNSDIRSGEDGLITSRTKVSSNESLNLFFDTLPSDGIVSIELLMKDSCGAEEEEWTQTVLVVPDLMRFSRLEKVVIDFIGDVQTFSTDGELMFPTRVWMFALRNATLSSNLLFGEDELYEDYPKTVIALQDASLTGEVNWQTSVRDYTRRNLMLWTHGNVSFNIDSPEVDTRFVPEQQHFPSDVRFDLQHFRDERGGCVDLYTHLSFKDEQIRGHPMASIITMMTYELESYMDNIESSFENPTVELYRFFCQS
jgi:hypothetical protein